MLLVRLVDEWASFLPAATFDSFRANLGLTYRAAALALLAIGPGAIAGSAITVLADTRSRRVLASAGAGVYAVALALFAVASHEWMVVVGGAGVGLGATLLVDTVEVALADLCPDGNALERALARVNLAAGFGDLAGPLVVAGAAALGWSWRVPLAVTAAATAAYAVLVATAPLPAPARAAAGGPGPGPTFVRATIALVRRTDVWWAGACGAVLVALDESFVAYVIAYLHHDDHVSTAVATATAASFVAGGLVAAARLDRRHAQDRRHPVDRSLRTSAVAILAAAVLLGVYPVPLVVAASGVVLGAATIAFWIPFQAATLRLVPDRAATVTAIVGTLEMTGLAVAPLIGAISDAWGLRTGLAAYCTLPVVLVVLVTRVPAGVARRAPQRSE